MRAVEAHGAWVQVWPVDAARLPAWLRARARQLGLEASDAAFELLAARTEGNLLAAHQELMRLALLGAAGDSPGAAHKRGRGDASERRDRARERCRQRALRCLSARRGGARRQRSARTADARRAARRGYRGNACAVGAHQGAARRLERAGLTHRAQRAAGSAAARRSSARSSAHRASPSVRSPRARRAPTA